MRQRLKHGSPPPADKPVVRKRKATVEKTASGKPMAKVLIISTPANYYDNIQLEPTEGKQKEATIERTDPTDDTALPPTHDNVRMPTPDAAQSTTSDPLGPTTPDTTQVQTSDPEGSPTPDTTQGPTSDPVGPPTPDTTQVPTSDPVGPPTPDTAHTPTSNTLTQPTSGTACPPTSDTTLPTIEIRSQINAPFRLGRPLVGLGPMQSELQATEHAMQLLLKDNEKMRRNEEKRTKTLIEVVEALKVIQSDQRELIDVVKTALQRQPLVDMASIENTPTIPEGYGIDENVLRDIHRVTNGPGNFAAHLTQKMNQELFGLGQLRLHYNYYGGGKLGKKELCPVKKAVIRKYVTRFYPEVAHDIVWRDTVVPKINELLRRRNKQNKTVTAYDNAHQSVPANITVRAEESHEVAEDTFVGLLNSIDTDYINL